MTVFTWDAGDGTSTADWTGPSNWDQKSSYPQAGDTAIINAGFHKCYVNAASECTTLTINGDAGDVVLELQAALEVTGFLSVVDGTLDTGADHALTVGITLEVDDATAVLNCNDSALTIGQVDIDANVGLYNSGGTINGGTGDWTISNVRHNSGTTVLSTGTIIINGKEASSGAAMDIRGAGLTHTAGLIQLGNDDGNIVFYGHNALTLYNLEITSAGHDVSTDDTDNVLTITNDLTITAGDLNTHKSGQDVLSELTVGGTTTIGSAGASAVDEATLITNESTIDLQGTNGGSPGLEMLAGGTFNGVGNANHTMGSVKAQTTTYNSKIYFTSGTTTVNEEYTGNYAFVVFSTSDVNFYHGSGTVEITTPTYAYMYTYEPFYNLIINHAGGAGQKIALSNGVPLAVDNDLIFTDGDFLSNLENITVGGNCEMNNAGHEVDVRGCRGFTVAGDCLLASGATFIAGEHPSYPGYYSRNTTFKSLTISGSWTATLPENDTYATVITGRSDSFGHTNSWIVTGGGAAFIANGGSVYFNGAGDMQVRNNYGKGNFYNLYVDNSSGDVATYGDNTIDNNIIVYDTNGNHDLRFSSDSVINVGRNVEIVSGTLCNQTAHTGTINVSGNFILSDPAAKFGGNASNDLTVNLYGNLINNGGEIV